MGLTGGGARRARAATVLVCAGAVMCLLASPVAAQPATGLAQAKSALLKQSDFPSGWSARGSGYTSNGSSNSLLPGGTQALQQSGTCIGASSAMQKAAWSLPAVASPVFVSGASFVGSAIGVFANTNLAQQYYAMFSSPKAPSCMAAAYQSTLIHKYLAYETLLKIQNGATLGTITVTRPDPSWLVPQATGVTISVPITYYQGATDTDVVTATEVATMIVLVRGHAVSILVIGSQGQQVPASLAHHLIATAYGRISTLHVSQLPRPMNSTSSGPSVVAVDCQVDFGHLAIALEFFATSPNNKAGSYPQPPAQWSAATYQSNFEPLLPYMHATLDPTYYVIEYDGEGHIWVEPPGQYDTTYNPAHGSSEADAFSARPLKDCAQALK